MVKKSARHCQPCTACCDGWVKMKIGSADVYPSHPCPHSTGKGCADYANRPSDPCNHFNCAWIIKDSPLPDWMKPSNAKAILMLNKREWHGFSVDVAVPVGKRIPPRSLKWLQTFAEKNSRLLIYTEQIGKKGQFEKQQTVIAYGTEQFQLDVQRSQQAGMDLWQ